MGYLFGKEKISSGRKYAYKGSVLFLPLFSLLLALTLTSFALFVISFHQVTWFWVLLPLEAVILVGAVINWSVNLFYKPFSIRDHKCLVNKHLSTLTTLGPLVDIYLPVCGEPLSVLRNTWEGVQNLGYKNIRVYVLDDFGQSTVENLSNEFGFNYLSRPNKGEFKKSGNLQYGFANSQGDFNLILDADFRPDPNMIDEMLPYFLDDRELAILQSPQSFPLESNKKHHVTLLEQGAAAIQAYFYKIVQPSRSRLKATICCGSCAMYRREALKTINGCVLKEHSEDIWNGFILAEQGWKVKYLPVKVSQGLCPDSLKPYYKQQSRWCSASLDLVSSKHFRKSRTSFRSKVCYLAGFLYYVSTPLYFVLPIVYLLLASGDIQYMFVTPSLIQAIIIWSILISSKPGLSPIIAQLISQFTSMFTILRKIFRFKDEWIPSGANMARGKKFDSYQAFLFFVVLYAFGYLGLFTWRASEVDVTGGLVGWPMLNALFMFILSAYFIHSMIVKMRLRRMSFTRKRKKVAKRLSKMTLEI